MKKLLALVLALVMSMSLVTISNADFKDADKIDYTEAVDVMNAVGVFVGDEKGNFNAKENLTREQAAKIIAYLELGSKAADALVGGATFTDVASSRWSAGFVGYCAQAGIVSGVGDSKFDPAGQLTALQFGKMLLVELGYDAKAEGMVGTDWAINTSKLMAGTKLMDGISGSVNQVLTREKAAQMCLNALEAPMVTYDTKGSTITVDGTKINFGASVAKYETSTIAKDQNISKEKLTSGEYTVELGEKLYKDLKKNSTTDAFERPATEWMLKAKSIGTYADAADLSYTATVEIGTIYSDLGLSKGIDDSKVTYYEDGRNLSSSWNQDIVKGSKVEKGGNGTLLEVYYNDDAESLTVIAINTYVGKITASYKASTTKDAYVTFTPKNSGDPGSSYETDDSYSKDDIVLYTYSYKAGDAGVKSMALAEKVTGKMNGFTADEYLHPYTEWWARADKELHGRTIQLTEKLGIPNRQVGEGDTLTLGGAELKLHRYTKVNNTNAKSLLTKVTFGHATVLLCADITGRAQKGFLTQLAPEDLKADVIKIPHHGITPVEPDFLTAVSPEFAIVTNYADEKRLSKLMYQLEGRGIPHYFSGEGTVELATDGTDWYVWQTLGEF